MVIIEGFRGTVNYTGNGIIDAFQTAVTVIGIGGPQISSAAGVMLPTKLHDREPSPVFVSPVVFPNGAGPRWGRNLLLTEPVNLAIDLVAGRLPRQSWLFAS